MFRTFIAFNVRKSSLFKKSPHTAIARHMIAAYSMIAIMHGIEFFPPFKMHDIGSSTGLKHTEKFAYSRILVFDMGECGKTDKHIHKIMQQRNFLRAGQQRPDKGIFSGNARQHRRRKIQSRKTARFTDALTQIRLQDPLTATNIQYTHAFAQCDTFQSCFQPQSHFGRIVALFPTMRARIEKLAARHIPFTHFHDIFSLLAY